MARKPPKPPQPYYYPVNQGLSPEPFTGSLSNPFYQPVIYWLSATSQLPYVAARTGHHGRKP